MPFYIHISGGLIWTNKNSQLHREDGPAVIWPDGHMEYWLNSKLHREYGPAMIYPDGQKAYYLNGESYSENEYYKALKKLK